MTNHINQCLEELLKSENSYLQKVKKVSHICPAWFLVTLIPGQTQGLISSKTDNGHSLEATKNGLTVAGQILQIPCEILKIDMNQEDPGRLESSEGFPYLVPLLEQKVIEELCI